MAKMLDPKNVTVRADRMMKEHLNLFEKYFGEYEKEGSTYRFNVDDNAIVEIYYSEASKLLTKTFSTTVKIIVKNVEMRRSWKAKLQLRGLIKVDKILLKELDANSVDAVAKLNSNKVFMGNMFSLFKNFDLHSVSFEYKQAEGQMNIIITPYPGSFIWVKLPPIYYDVRLRPEEIKKMHDMAIMFSEFFTKDKVL